MPVRGFTTRLTVLATGVILLLGFPSLASAADLFVSTTGSNASNCQNDASPCQTIQYAVGQAASGDTVNLAAGTYTGAGNTEVLINSDVDLAFEGSGMNQTIISGGGTANLFRFDTPSAATMNIAFRDLALVDGDGGTSAAAIQEEYWVTLSLELTRVLVEGNTSTGDGGAIRTRNGNVTIHDSTFSDNQGSYQGGAIRAASVAISSLQPSASTPTTLFAGNSVSSGEGGAVSAKKVIASDVAFEANVADDGGAIAIGTDSTETTAIQLTRSVFSGNQAGIGGAFRVSSSGAVAVTDSVFDSNQATNSGGVMRVDSPGQVAVNRSTMTGNTSTNAFAVGDLGQRDLTLISSTVDGNAITSTTGSLVFSAREFAITNSTLTNNASGPSGYGLLYSTGGDIRLRSTTSSGNAVNSNHFFPGGGGSLDIANSIINETGTFVCTGATLVNGGGNVLTTTVSSDCDGLVGPSPATKVSASSLALGTLADNGGPTKTIALGPGSSALGVSGQTTACPAEDQRGEARPSSGCDAGAYELLSYPLTVTKAGTGSGTVTGAATPAGGGSIDCGASCSGTFDGGTVVELTASAVSGSSFSGWSGEGCSGSTATCTVTMNQARSVTATFNSTAPPPTPATGGVSPPAPNTPPQPKVTLCHSGNGKNFTTITIAPEAAIDGHAKNHDDDIIPPFDYVKNGKTLRFAGQNWNSEGRAILDNGCRSPSSNPANSIFNPPEVNKVTLCHSGNGKNFVEITIAPQGVLNGHSRNHSHDIIPPFSFGGTSFPGQNWDASGQGIFNNGCERPQPVTDPVEEPAQKVSICHSAAGKKFVSIEVAVAAALNGHAAQHQEDIIPPFKYRDNGKEKTFPGQNWDSEGQAIFNNGCVPPAPPPNQPDPQPVTPTVTCVDVASDGSYTAYFGYQSSGLVAQTVAAGVDNSVTLSAAGSGASSSGAPTVFQPGVVGSAVTVSGIASGGSALWSITVGGKTSTAIASSESTRCEPEPAPVDFGLFAVCTESGTGGTYSVTFGYQNDNVLPVNVPIGRNNRVLVDGQGGPDRGQPTTLAAGRNGNAFTVSGLKTSKSVAWEVTVGGLQRVATADSSTPACASPPVDPEPEPEPQALEPVGPSVRCVALNSDGTYDVVFGYSNPNLVTIEVPAGAANGLRVSPDGPGPETRGQPTAFEPGSVGNAFSVTKVPAGQEITWTVASYGTRSATAGIGFPTRCEGDTPEKTPEPPPIDPEPARQAIGIYLKCVDAGKSTYSATFGYVNPGSVALTIPVGEDNRLVGSSRNDRGQPSIFAPGDASEAFRLEGIDLDGRPTWRITNPDGSVVTAVADPAAPNCTTGNPERGPETDVDPDIPPKGPIKTEIDNPGTETDWKPTTTFEVPNKAKVTHVKGNGVKCQQKGRKVTCKTSKLLPGEKAKVTIQVRCRRPGSGVLGVASVVNDVALKPGEVSSGSGTVRARGCKRPKPKPPTG